MQRKLYGLLARMAEERGERMTFNEAVCDLIKHLRLTYQAPDGTIYWYEGTVQLLFEVLGFLYEGLEAEVEE